MPGLTHEGYMLVKEETNHGTKVVAGMEAVECESDSLGEVPSEKVSIGINNSRHMTKRQLGGKTVGGEIPFEINAEDAVGIFLKHTLPTEVMDDDGVGNGAKHKFTTSDVLPPGITAQASRDTEVTDYFGGRMVSFNIGAASDDLLKGNAALSFVDAEPGTPQTPVYSPELPLVYHQGAAEIDAGAAIIKELSNLTIATGLKIDRRRIGSRLIQIQQPGVYDITGSMQMYFDDMVMVNKFLTGAPISLQFEFTGTSIGITQRSLKIFLPQVYLNGETPKLAGRDDEIILTFPFRAIKAPGSELIEATLANSRRTVYA